MGFIEPNRALDLIMFGVGPQSAYDIRGVEYLLRQDYVKTDLRY